MNQTLIQAINTHQVLTICYNGGIRVIEPHCYGLGSSGQELLRCFQVSGHSNSGQPTAWKLMTADKIETMEATGREFGGPRPGYNHNGDKAIPTIYAKI